MQSPPPPLPFPSSSLSQHQSNTNVHTRLNSALSASSSPLPAHSRQRTKITGEDRQNEQVFLFKHPRKTLALFASSLATSCLTVVLSMRKLRLGHMLILIPTVVLVLFALMPQHYDTAVVNGDVAAASLQSLLNKIRMHIRFFIWWLVLGILSSIGVGTGLQSGLLFLFPFIFKITSASQRCQSLDFDYERDVFFADPSSIYYCPHAHNNGANPATSGPVFTQYADAHAVDVEKITYFEVLMAVMPAAVVWGAGTAIGEVPPYALAYAAAKAGDNQATLDEIENQIKSPQRPGKEKSFDFSVFVEKSKFYMIKLIEKTGFWGIFMLASWPNAFFDLCGICCGTFQMPFWTFMSGTLLGKACVKAPMQAAAVIMVFRKKSRANFIRFLHRFFPQFVSHFAASLLRIADETIATGGQQHKPSLATAADSHAAKLNAHMGFKTENVSAIGLWLFKNLWMSLIVLLMAWFVKAIIEQIANQKLKADADKALSNKKL